MTKSFWEITGYDGTDKIFQRLLPQKGTSSKNITTILQRLAARHLTGDEIVSASLRRNAKNYRSDLEIIAHKFDRTFSTSSSGWHYIAKIIKTT